MNVLLSKSRRFNSAKFRSFRADRFRKQSIRHLAFHQW
ncbi:hypothetical protein SynPROS91_01430 [Synechococcus sp. PROS-9-1]|nr:hypothetical protein SynPROS91_01430 [Synechococcus sp. PROS-9-1]